MKKIVCLILMISALQSHALGAIVGSGYATDIKAFIDYMMVPSYNIDGYTAVIVRDLEPFGFTVNWDESTKTVTFYRDFAKPLAPTVPVHESRPVGTKVFDVYSTDIRTFYRDKEIPSYNIGGKTAVRLRDLAMVGEATFDATTKSADVFCRDVDYFDDEISYFRNQFYGNLLFLSRADAALQPMVSMLENGKYDSGVVNTYKAFFDSMMQEMETFKTFKEPYGFDGSAQELWWAMVNMRYAGETALVMSDVLKNGGNISAAMTDYKQYRIDSLEQRRVALLVLDEEMQALTMFW